MKTTMLLLLLLMAIGASATIFLNTPAGHEPKPRWACENGYWIVQSADRLTHTIRFYTNNNELVYSESVTNVRLNIDKPRVKMKLKRTLDVCLASWQKDKKAKANLALVRF